jgi:hypothetical protein
MTGELETYRIPDPGSCMLAVKGTTAEDGKAL